MAYDNKIAMVIHERLESWQKLNVAAFLAGSVAIQFPETHGKPFVNASNSTYLPFITHPILIFSADSDAAMKRAFNRAKERDLAIGIYTAELFATKNEEENLVQIANFTDESQNLAGIILYGDSKKVSKALDGLKFHP